jgi:hypothetical protein
MLMLADSVGDPRTIRRTHGTERGEYSQPVGESPNQRGSRPNE